MTLGEIAGLATGAAGALIAIGAHFRPRESSPSLPPASCPGCVELTRRVQALEERDEEQVASLLDIRLRLERIVVTLEERAARRGRGRNSIP